MKDKQFYFIINDSLLECPVGVFVWIKYITTLMHVLLQPINLFFINVFIWMFCLCFLMD